MSRRHLLAVCAWCIPFALVEILLYLSYRGHDARFHWFTHFFVGAAFALVLMTALAALRGRPVPLPLVWPVLAHAYAMFPDFLFVQGVAHCRWMDIFLGHISTHFIWGGNVTWYVVFAVALGAYVVTVDRIGDAR